MNQQRFEYEVMREQAESEPVQEILDNDPGFQEWLENRELGSLDLLIGEYYD